MDFLQVVGDRRTIRWFKTWEQVPTEKIQRILEAVRLSTCPGNLQPWRAVVVVRDELDEAIREELLDRKSTRLNSSHSQISYAVFCLKKKKKKTKLNDIVVLKRHT